MARVSTSKQSKVQGKQRGFTLLEILVVLVILGLLASLVGPQVFKQLEGSKSKTAALQIEELGAALDLYRLEVGSYPSTSEGLNALIEAPSGVSSWNGPYLKKKVIRDDPWGMAYEYKYPGDHGEFDLMSLGADKKAGGEGDDRDVVSWE
ncbi:MAG: type II secretion system major pseudopilin GspG [Oceanospirillaceae bacterium]|nr:type II secretion system major pseudopilin GspG [Oceanospirillaceae bacterium]